MGRLPLLAVLALAPAAAAQDEEFAKKLVEAHRKGDEQAFLAVARGPSPDAWGVAHLLCSGGEHAVALAYAKARSGPDTEALPAYVESRRTARDDPEARAAIRAAKAALSRGDAAAGLEALEAVPREGTVTSVLALYLRGGALRALGRVEEADAAQREASAAAEELGWLALASHAIWEVGAHAYNRHDWDVAGPCFEKRVSFEERRGNDALLAQVLTTLGAVYGNRQRLEESARVLERALKLYGRLEDPRGRAAALQYLGTAYSRLARWREAIGVLRESQKASEVAGNRFAVAATLREIGEAHAKLSEFEEAQAALKESMLVAREIGNRELEAGAGVTLGSLLGQLGDFDAALSHLDTALRTYTELDLPDRTASALAAIGTVHMQASNYLESLDYLGRALALAEKEGDTGRVAPILADMGLCHQGLGDQRRSLELLRRSLEIRKAIGDRHGVAICLLNIATSEFLLGRHAEAFSLHQESIALMRELGDRAGLAVSLSNGALVHEELEEYDKALAMREEALRIAEEVGDRKGVMEALVGLGGVRLVQKDLEGALACYERAHALAEELGLGYQRIATLGNIGLVHLDSKRLDAAQQYQEKTLALAEKLGEKRAVVETLGNLGEVKADLGDREAALGFFRRAVEGARELHDPKLEVLNLWRIAEVQLKGGHARDALESARAAVAKLGELLSGFSEERGAKARAGWSDLLDFGARAALEAGDEAALAYFLESGRAGALLESLGGRDALARASIPEALRETERRARGALIAARARHDRAQEARNLKESRAARAALEQAQDGLQEAVARIQQEAKAQSDLLYPRAASLNEIQESLEPGDALVLYALLEEDALALVVRRDGTRVVRLGKSAAIDAAARDLVVDDAEGQVDPSRLKALLVEPLGLDGACRRILVSPDGRISLLPFTLLVPDREVVHVPSGTTYRMLAAESRAGKSGRDVLGVGDPDYGAPAGKGRGALQALPASRGEVEAVADVTLLGKEATAKGLERALRDRERWRGVHLACHGLVDTERPLLSALALTPSLEDDGYLRVLDIYSARIPADLVVLSACETGIGKVYKAEGVVGFTRAFLFAGAPRVVVSLWKVNDEATRALMTRFYSLWNPKDGSKSLPAATALKMAMESVRDDPDHPKWKHPFYWAAWQLWGLPQ